MYTHDENEQSANRISIWSVSEGDLRLYSIVFPALWAIITAFHIFFGIDWQKEGWIGGIDKFLLETGILGVSAAVLGMILLVLRRIVMVLFDWPSKRERAVRRAFEAGRQAEREARRQAEIIPDADIFEVQIIASDNSIRAQRQFDNLSDAKFEAEQERVAEGDTVQVVHFVNVDNLTLVRDVFRLEQGSWYKRIVE